LKIGTGKPKISGNFTIFRNAFKGKLEETSGKSWKNLGTILEKPW
jgi:hypothetical protein